MSGKDQTPQAQMQRNIRAVALLERKALHERTTADRVSDALTRFTGSTRFVVGHALAFSGWLLANTGRLPGVAPFDPYPFSFLTLVVSLEAIFLSVFVLMSQNRMTRQADKRAHLDLQIDLLAERELTLILHMVRGLCQREGVPLGQVEADVRELLEETDLHTLSDELDQRLPST